MQLYSKTYPENMTLAHLPDTPLVILPGLFGSTNNWRGVAKQLAENRPVIVLDQRNHGQSPHANSNTYEDMVADLLQFCDDHKLVKIHLAGHSMGGKVAMLFALQHADRLESLIIIDIAPATYEHSYAPYLEALMQLDLGVLSSRGEADRKLQATIPDTAIRLFLLQSLSGGPGRYKWRLNLPILHQSLAEIGGFPEIDDVCKINALFLLGGRSNYVSKLHRDRLKKLFPNAIFETVQGAGHWVHADEPQAVVNIIEDHL